MRACGRAYRQPDAPSIRVALGAVIAGTRAASRCRSQRAAVNYRRRGLLLASSNQAQQGAQALSQRLETLRRHSALHLLIDRSPRREVVRHGWPGDAVADDMTKSVDQLSHRVVPLRSRFLHQRQIRSYQRPFLVIDVRRMGLASGGGRRQPPPLNLLSRKYITPSRV